MYPLNCNSVYSGPSTYIVFVTCALLFLLTCNICACVLGDESCSDTRGIEVALNQRVDGITSKLPMYYCLYRPHISLVPSVIPADDHSNQRALSLNWSQGDVSLEVVDGVEGKSVDE